MTIAEAWETRKRRLKIADTYARAAERSVEQSRTLRSEADSNWVELVKNSASCHATGELLKARAEVKYAEADMYAAIYNTYRAKEHKIRAKISVAFLEAVIAELGNVKMEWESDSCIIAGVEYR